MHSISYLVVEALILMSLFPTGIAGKKNASKQNYSYGTHKEMAKRRECSRNECIHTHLDENEGCVDECVSQECYDKIYRAEPLEPGEVDQVRRYEFNSCLEDVARERNKANKEEVS